MAKKKTDIRLVVVFSDLHSGSRRSLMPPEYALFEEGEQKQIIKANKQQLWLYDCWCRGWEKVINYVGGDPWAWAFIGDAVEGTHRRMTEIRPVVSPIFRTSGQAILCSRNWRSHRRHDGDETWRKAQMREAPRHRTVGG